MLNIHLLYKTPSTFSCNLESEILSFASQNQKRQAKSFYFWLFLGSKRHFNPVISAWWQGQEGEMTRSKRLSDQKFSREFFEKSPFWLSQKAHIFIMRWLSDRYKNTLFFAEISPREFLVQKNRFSEPVFCQKTQQWEDAANIRLQVSFLLLSFYVSFYSITFLLFYLYPTSSIFTTS